jgi:hypothetical protein
LVIDSLPFPVIARVLLLSMASELLYLLLGGASLLEPGEVALPSSYHPARVEETVAFFSLWAGLFLFYALAVRAAERGSSRALVVIVFLTSALFHGTLLWRSDFDQEPPDGPVFLGGPTPISHALEAAGERATSLPIADASASLANLGSLTLAPGLLRAASLPVGLTLILGWNPLLVKETAGNGRTAAVAVFFLFLSFRLAQRRWPTLAACAYGVSLMGPMSLWATLPLLVRALRLRVLVSLLLGGAAWAALSLRIPWDRLLGWPPSDSTGGSIIPALETLTDLFLTRNHDVVLAMGGAAWLFVAVLASARLRSDLANLPEKALLVVASFLFLAPQAPAHALLPMAALSAFSRNRGFLVFTATAPLAYLGFRRGSRAFFLGFVQYFPAYASLIYSWLGRERDGKR